MSKDHFAVLGLKPGASEDEIKKSYRSLAKQWHPDKNKNAGAEEKFKEISASYDYLQSKDRREILERDLNRKKEAKKTGSSYTHSSSFFNTNTGTRNTYSETYTSASKTQSDKKENKDAGKSKKDPHWTSSFFGKNKQKRKPEKKEWSQEWEGTPGYRGEGRYTAKSGRKPPTFSFAFQSFVDHLDSEFETFFTEAGFGASPFGSAYTSPEPGFHRIDPFADLFNPVLLNPTQGAKKKKPPVRRRNVARESGSVEGLNEEYLFSPRQGQSQGRFEYASDDSDLSSDGEFGYDADKAAAHVPCHYCGKLFQAYKLYHHEQSCGRFDDSSGDEKDYFSPHDRPHKSTGDWRQTQAELHEQIRRAKEAARAKAAEENYVTVPCKWCGRQFSKQAAERHIPFCERWTKQHGKPMNPAGPSKSERAKQYSKKVPHPGGRKDGRSAHPHPDLSDHSDEESSPSHTHSSQSHYSQGARKTKGAATHQSQKSVPQPKKPAQQTKKQASQSQKGQGSSGSFFGVSGASLNKKPGAGSHGSEGCAKCRKTYGSDAKFACSCGTRNTLR